MPRGHPQRPALHLDGAPPPAPGVAVNTALLSVSIEARIPYLEAAWWKLPTSIRGFVCNDDR
jgi:hypothetical protein